MTRRVKIIVAVAVLVAAVVTGSAIAQATSSDAPKRQTRTGNRVSVAAHKLSHAAKHEKAEAKRLTTSRSQSHSQLDVQGATTEQPEAQEPAEADDDPAEANDDDQGDQNEQAGDDDQGEQEHATADDDDDSSQATSDDEEDDDSAEADDEHDDDGGDDD